ncbi:MAG: glycoside hydrolase family 78 protein, partial [Oscillospiraceae bacterium]|nr:glycoside hydrolase family 78 protein [Oscillospiraceae bacterium]
MKKLIAFTLTLCMVLASVSGVSFSAPNPQGSLPGWSTSLTNLTVNYRENPLGIETDNLRFGWIMDSNVIGIAQSAYQIVVNEGAANGSVVWDSGTVNSGLSVAVPFGGNTSAFKTETRYYWTVTVTDVFGNRHAATSYFETGADWTNVDWITKDGYASNMYVLMFRTQEKVASNAAVASARLYITGLGTYYAYINGRAVQGEKSALLAPGWTDYTDYVNYQTYDVSSYITGNDIALAAYVGSGFYAGRNGGSQTGTFRNALNATTSLTERCLLAKLVIKYADGKTQEIVTSPDGNWQVSGRTPITGAQDGIGRNEYFDGRIAREFEGWNDVGFDYTSTSADWSGSAKMIYAGTGTLGKNLIGGDYGVAYEYKRLPWIKAYQYKDWVTTGSYPNFSIVDPGDIKPGELYFGGDSEYRTGEIDPDKMISYTQGDTITVKDGYTLVLDFGQNASGVPNMIVSGNTPGVVLNMYNGENVSDGNSQRGGIQAWNPNTMPYPKGVINYESGAGNGKQFRYTLAGDGKLEYYQAKFHFVGYRYLALKPTGGDVTIHSFESVTYSSVGKESGFVETSNPYMEKFLSASKWSQVGNFVSVPTDCPTREYNGWTGDINAFCETALYHFDSTATIQHFTEIMNKGYMKRGNYNTTMPTTSNGSPSCGWTDAAISVPWAYYMATGDTSQLRQCWPQIKSYVDGMNGRSEYGTTFRNAYNGGVNTAIGWGDHLGIYITSGRFLNCAYHLYDNVMLAKIGKLLGEDVSSYEAMIPVIKNYMIKRYIDADGNVLSRTAATDETTGGTVQRVSTIVDNAQTAVSWMIVLDIFDTDSQRDAMAANLAKSVYNKNGEVYANLAENIIAAGFLGVHKVLPALSKTGQTDAAFALATSTNRNSFMYGVAAPPVPATSIWEEWVTWGANPGEGYTGGSQNHYSYGASSAWLYEYMLGIAADESNPGYKHTILQPSITDRLDFANGSYESHYGVIKSGWTANGGALSAYNCVVPANTTATLFLPVKSVGNLKTVYGAEFQGMDTHNGVIVAEFELMSGGYDFTVDNGNVVVAYADQYIGPVLAEIRADEAILGVNTPASYTVSLMNVRGAGVVTLSFIADGRYLDLYDATALNGFSILDPLSWEYVGSQLWKGTVKLYYPGLVNVDGPLDVLRV